MRSNKKVQTKRQSEKHLVGEMIAMYCRRVHKSHPHTLCAHCLALRSYAWQRVDHCPFMENKTFCSACKVHCYHPHMRAEIRNVMRWAGPRLLWTHPVLAVRHLIETRKGKYK